MEKEITLLEALTGVNILIDFLDGKQLAVSNKPGQVIKQDTIMTVEEKGLPFHKNPYKFGNLFILFSVKFPMTLEAAQISSISKVLQNQKKKDDVDMEIAETVTLVPFSEE